MADNKTLGIALGIGGLVVVGIALASQAGGGTTPKPVVPPPAGHNIGALVLPELDASSQALPLPIGTPIMLYAPAIYYSGPGLDLFTYFSLVQKQGGTNVTVYGSGVAGVHVGPATTSTLFQLVAASQPQPTDHSCDRGGLSAGPWMCAYPWKDPHIDSTAPICGGPPVAGPADLYVEVFESAADSGNSADGNGFTSPTCNVRTRVAMRSYYGRVTLTGGAVACPFSTTQFVGQIGSNYVTWWNGHQVYSGTQTGAEQYYNYCCAHPDLCG